MVPIHGHEPAPILIHEIIAIDKRSSVFIRFEVKIIVIIEYFFIYAETRSYPEAETRSYPEAKAGIFF